MTALEDVPADFVLRLLNYPAYFDLLSRELPSDKIGIIEALSSDDMITQNLTGNEYDYLITNPPLTKS